MSKKQTSTQSTDVDPRTQQMRGDIYDAARAAAGFGAGGGASPGFRTVWTPSGVLRIPIPGSGGGAAPATAPGLNPLLNGTNSYYNNSVTQGNLGLNALGGDSKAVQTLMNPYQSQVLDALTQQWDKINKQTTTNLNDEATRAGAFGGTRQGVAQGVALSNNAQAQQAQVAGLLQGGFNDAISRAGVLANLGMGGAGAIPGFNEYARGFTDPNLFRMRTLQAGLQGVPYGQTNTTTQNRNVGSGILGGVLGAKTAGLSPWLGLLGAL